MVIRLLVPLALVLVWTGGTPTQAAITTFGGVTPTHMGQDPWMIAGQLFVDDQQYFDPNTSLFGNSFVSVTAGSRITSGSGRILGGSSFFNSGGSVVLQDAGSRWTTSGDLTLEGGTFGGLTVRNGAFVAVGGNLLADGAVRLEGASLSNVFGQIANEPGSAGTVTVSGAGSSWTNSVNLFVGLRGSGSLRIEGGGSVQNVHGTVGSAAGSTGTATVTGAGSAWTNSGNFTVGSAGTGQLAIAGGGSVSYVGSGWIGAVEGGTGTVTVTGAGSTWLNTASFGTLQVGSIGQGTLLIDDCGSVLSFDVSIASFSSSAGTATVTGDGSTWTISSNLSIGWRGEGQLMIDAGGTVESTLTMIGREGPGKGSVVVTGEGSTWTNSDELRVGESGEGALMISDGASVSNTLGRIGAEAGSSGTVNVSGDGSNWTSSSILSVGETGTGTLTISDGGTVSNFNGFLGLDSGSTGTATVTGAGSTWNNPGGLFVGSSGTGTLTVAGGAAVSSAGAGHIGSLPGSHGTATVTGAGSTWAHAGQFLIGFEGTGILTIAGGAAVSSSDGRIGSGFGTPGTGTVIVSGAGSTWTMNGGLGVGTDGTGTLTIEAGGSVSNNTGFIGRFTGSTGHATVSGPGSRWTMTGRLSIGGDMFLGDGGTGTLTIEPGGTVSVAQATLLFPDGLLELAGGTLATAAISFENDAPFTQFNWTSGTLHVGSFNGDLVNQAGTLAPGASAGLTSISGDYTQHSGATLWIELGGTTPGVQHDRLEIAGHLNAGGTLVVMLIDGFIPLPGEQFEVLSFGSRSGDTEIVNETGLAGLTFEKVYTSTSLTLLAGALFAGDANLDGRVDGEDFLIWQANFGMQSGATWDDGDFNGDGRVDGEDFLIWQASFGQVASSTGLTPEPSVLGAVLALGSLLMLRRRTP